MNIKFFLVTLYSLSLTARYHTVVKDQEFDDLLNQYEYAVVCFAPSFIKDRHIDKAEKKEVSSQFKHIKKQLKAASDVESFKHYLKDEVGFLLIDTASGQVSQEEEFLLDVAPVCLLFKQGKVIFAIKQYAQLFEPISKHSLIAFMSSYFKRDFNEIIKDKKYEENEQRKERMARYQASALVSYPYQDYGYYTGYPYDTGFYGRGYFGSRYYGGYGVGLGVGAGYSYGYW